MVAKISRGAVHGVPSNIEVPGSMLKSTDHGLRWGSGAECGGGGGGLGGGVRALADLWMYD
jgi:hypothetical protein